MKRKLHLKIDNYLKRLVLSLIDIDATRLVEGALFLPVLDTDVPLMYESWITFPSLAISLNNNSRCDE